MLTQRLILTLGCLALATVSHAQDSLLFRDYQFVKDSDPWLTSRNAAGLVRYASSDIAEAEVSLTKEKGGFVDFDGSSDVWKAGGQIESFYRFNSRTVFYGAISFNSFDGKEMTGSVFTPSLCLSSFSTSLPSFSSKSSFHRPLDIVEDSLTNAGDKHLDTYRLTGRFAHAFSNGLSVGMSLDYTAANYAKYKDLRHQNKLMDLCATAGIYIPFAKWGNTGANYLYRRNTESVDFSTFGTSDKVYKSLIDYAAFMGHVEQFGNEGFTDKSREMPLTNDYHGANVQLNLRFSRQTQFFNEFGYQHRTGYYGRKSPYTITYSEHRSDSYEYHARASHQTNTSMYMVDFSLDWEDLTNDANTYREQQNESKATYYEYYIPVKTANKRWANYALDLTLHFGIRNGKSVNGLFVDGLPTWTIHAGANWSERQQTGYSYPFYRKQQINNYEFYASLTRNIIRQHGVWTLTLNGSFMKGDGQPYEDHTYQQPSDKQSSPPTMEAFLMREYQYLTAPQYGIGCQAKYAFVFPGTKLKTHASINLQHRKANAKESAYSCGTDRTIGTIAIGCTF